MKKATVIIAAVIALAGCGRSSDAAPGTAAGAAPDGKASGSIEVWGMGTEGELLPQLAEQFEKEFPDVTVNVTAVPWDSAQQKISTAITSGQTPDVVQVGTTWMAGFVDQGGFAPTPSGLVDESSFFPGAWDTAVVGGTAYGVPWYYGTNVLFYRSDLANGLTPPADWAGLTGFTKGMQSAGAKYGITLQTHGQDTTLAWIPFFFQAGGEVLNDQGEFELDSQATRDALDFYASFMEDGIAPAVSDPDVTQQGFVDGSIGSFASGPYDITNLATVGGDDFSSKYSLTPLPPGKTDGAFAGGSDLAVFADAKNPDAAWEFVKYLSKPETQTSWYELSSDGPAVSAAWQEESLASDTNMQAFAKALDYAKSVPAIPTWAEIQSQIDEIIEQRIAGQIDSATAAQKMQEAATSIGTGLD
jgi:multiple sugar transport system substrate-binding protein